MVALLLLMLPVCGVLGGALFNPANNALLYATGQGELVGHAARVVRAELQGAVLSLPCRACSAAGLPVALVACEVMHCPSSMCAACRWASALAQFSAWAWRGRFCPTPGNSEQMAS